MRLLRGIDMSKDPTLQYGTPREMPELVRRSDEMLEIVRLYPDFVSRALPVQTRIMCVTIVGENPLIAFKWHPKTSYISTYY